MFKAERSLNLLVLASQPKQSGITFEKPHTLFLPKSSTFQIYFWELECATKKMYHKRSKESKTTWVKQGVKFGISSPMKSLFLSHKVSPAEFLVGTP